MVDYQPYVDEGAFALDTAEAFFMPDDPYGDVWFTDEPPPDLDYTPEDDPWLPLDDRFVSRDAEPQIEMPPPGQDGLQGFETPEPADEGWAWQDARLIGVERVAGDLTQYEIGCLDVYANLNSGDLGGSYLPIASFGDADVAAAYYHDLRGQMHDEGIADHQVPAFAERAAAQIQGQTPAWGGVWANEYEAYEQIRAAELSADAGDELPPAAFDPLLEEALRLGGVVQAVETTAPAIDDPSAFKALSAIGIEAPDFDPAKDPPPFYDPETGTAYWIGVFQPDQADQEHCVTSILSLGRGEDGELQAQLAPCVPGDWDKAYSAAEYLIGVAEKGGIDRCFEAAEGMALATDQRELWAAERGVPLAPDATRSIADYAQQEWEVEL
jgi:hypothetical protein